MNRALALSRFEAILLLRNRTAAGMALAMPLVFGALFAISKPSEDWTVGLTLQLVGALGLSVYVTSTIVLTARRQDLTLKRLRGGESTDNEILAGTLAPLAAVGLVQGVLMTAIALIAGAPAPANPAALLLAIAAGISTGISAGLLTAAITSTPETAQFTTGPYFFATFAGALWTIATPAAEVQPWHLAAPGGAMAELARHGLTAPADARPLWWAVFAALAWTSGAWALGTRVFRWDRR
ncbi:ABC transporter permease [Actinokineospora soli]|uniref:ABC transporter permease n=1 Tax=Actinokineospora soli TaxID=1048753 RepID=A0ABW2TJS5_9PSEU